MPFQIAELQAAEKAYAELHRGFRQEIREVAVPSARTLRGSAENSSVDSALTSTGVLPSTRAEDSPQPKRAASGNVDQSANRPLSTPKRTLIASQHCRAVTIAAVV